MKSTQETDSKEMQYLLSEEQEKEEFNFKKTLSIFNTKHVIEKSLSNGFRPKKGPTNVNLVPNMKVVVNSFLEDLIHKVSKEGIGRVALMGSDDENLLATDMNEEMKEEDS